MVPMEEVQRKLNKYGLKLGTLIKRKSDFNILDVSAMADNLDLRLALTWHWEHSGCTCSRSGSLC